MITGNKKSSRLIYKKIISPLAITWYVAASIVFITMLPVIRVEGDDFVYERQVSDLGTIPFLFKQLTKWSGRFFSEAMVGTILPLPQMVWRILNTLFVCLLVFSLIKLTFHTITIYSTIIGFSVIYLLTPSLLLASIYWTVGSFNYLWPAALALYSAIFLHKSFHGEKASHPFLYILSAFLGATGVEQIAPCLVIFSAVTFVRLLLKKQRISKWLIAYFFTAVVGMSIELFSPGSAIRTRREAKFWYPEFSSLSVLRKIQRGISWQFDSFANQLLPIAIILSITLCLYFVSSKKHTSYTDFFSIPSEKMHTLQTVCTFASLGIAIFLLDGESFGLGNSLFEFPEINRTILYNIPDSRNLPAIFSFIIWGAFWILLAVSYIWSSKDKITAFLQAGALMATGMVIYFSPTIYASGSRTMFIPSVLLILILTQAISSFRDGKKPLAVMVCIPAGINFLHFVLTISQGYSRSLF